MQQPYLETFICEKLLDMIELIPFQKIKVTEFVKFAGISRSSFYVYFDSVYSAVQKIEDDFIEGLTEDGHIILPQPSAHADESNMDPRLLSKVEYLHKNLRMIRILTGENGDPTFQVRMANRTWRLIHKQYAHKSHISEARRKMMCSYLCGGQLNLLRWYANHEEETSMYEMGILLEQLTLQTLSLME